MRDEPKVKLRLPIMVLTNCALATLMRSHERCKLLKTARTWPWKSESSKECVTTHLPKQLALKMEAARVLNLYFTVESSFVYDAISYDSTCRRVVLVALKAMRE